MSKRKKRKPEPVYHLAYGINLNQDKEIKVAYSKENGKAFLLEDDGETRTYFEVVRFKFIRWADR